MRTFFLSCRWPSSYCVPTWQREREREKALVSLVIKALMTSFNLYEQIIFSNTFFKYIFHRSYFQIHLSPWGLDVQHKHFGKTDIQCITDPEPKFFKNKALSPKFLVKVSS